MNESEVRTISVNGTVEPLTFDTVRALLDARGLDPGGRGIAIALNGAVLPRANWAEKTLQPGDAVEIVHAKQGG